MSKVGRYSADRKKIEDLSDSKTITVADCGTIFILASGSTGGSNAGKYTLTLPTTADAGNGWWCKMVLKETSGGDITVTGSSTYSISDGLNMFISTYPQDASALQAVPAIRNGTAVGGFVLDVSHLAVNDQVEIVSDGTNYYCTAMVSQSAGVDLAP